jgi:hypothetical protein
MDGVRRHFLHDGRARRAEQTLIGSACS